ncbi:MAG TPA: energy transducer TonB [Candidatus Acidoferrum sp.]|nr:energy transducer TonB [Candidatus Acidoferrum sp.]
MCLLVLILAASVFAQQQGDFRVADGRMIVPESYMAGKFVQKQEPVLPPAALAANVEGTVVLHAVVGKDGRIMNLDYVSGPVLLIQAAIETANKCAFSPVLLNSNPVEVETTVSVVFARRDGNAASKTGATESTAPVQAWTGPKTVIHLKNGRTIRADTVKDLDNKIEYTIGESIYRIRKDLIVEGSLPGGPLALSNSATGTDAAPQAAKPAEPTPDVTESSSGVPHSWYMYESTEELREECRTGLFATMVHPEFQTGSIAASPNEIKESCAALQIDMGPEYERLVNRGVELEKEMCAYGQGSMPQSTPDDARLAADFQELARISEEFSQRIKEIAKQMPSDRARSARMFIDARRMAGTCGQGAG